MSKKTETNTTPVSKKEKFLQVCTPRVDKAVKAINLVGLCAAPTYEYTDKQVEAVVAALINAVSTVQERFSARSASVSGFKMPD
jgi:hypothetical protein